jgi:hypothetical protein
MCWACNAFPARRRRSEQFGIVHKGHQHDQHVRCVRWQLDAPIIGQSLGFTIQTLDRAVRRARPERHHRALARRRSPDTAACVQRLPLPEEQLIGRLKSKITNSVGDVKEDFPRILCRWPPCCRPQAWILIDRVIYPLQREPPIAETSGRGRVLPHNRSRGVNVTVPALFAFLLLARNRRRGAV